jgi:hypothetical protein
VEILGLGVILEACPFCHTITGRYLLTRELRLLAVRLLISDGVIISDAVTGRKPIQRVPTPNGRNNHVVFSSRRSIHIRSRIRSNYKSAFLQFRSVAKRKFRSCYGPKTHATYGHVGKRW